MNTKSTSVSDMHGADQFKPNTTVAAVIVHGDKYLLVEEYENGNRVFNQPAGHLEADESIIDAVKREVLEETGLALKPEYLSGIYYYHRPELDLYFLRFCFVIKLTQQLSATPLDDDIIATHWFTLDQITAKQQQLRSPMVLECIEDYLTGGKNGEKIPLSMLKSNL
ncbi:MAG: phosphatase NudJ [Alteromonadaceae bacterium]|jgi:phosphatase NudJ